MKFVLIISNEVLKNLSFSSVFVVLLTSLLCCATKFLININMLAHANTLETSISHFSEEICFLCLVCITMHAVSLGSLPDCCLVWIKGFLLYILITSLCGFEPVT